MAVTYEWDVETVREYEDGENDVLEHSFQASYAECLEFVKRSNPGDGCRFDIVLVRDDDEARSWAYLVDGKLPEYAEDAYQNNHGKIPKRFRKEIESCR